MKLLVFDKEYCQEDGDCITILNKSLKDYSITLTTDSKDAKTLYENSKFDILLIDFTTKEGNEFLNYVMEKDSEQRVITIGYELTHSEIQGCEYCEKNYKRRRLVKPISVVDLYRTVVNFDEMSCDYRNKFNDTKVILKQILCKYSYFDYDELSCEIYSNINGTQVLRQYLDLVNDLNIYKINYQIIDDTSIKVLSF